MTYTTELLEYTVARELMLIEHLGTVTEEESDSALLATALLESGKGFSDLLHDIATNKKREDFIELSRKGDGINYQAFISSVEMRAFIDHLANQGLEYHDWDNRLDVARKYIKEVL